MNTSLRLLFLSLLSLAILPAVADEAAAPAAQSATEAVPRRVSPLADPRAWVTPDHFVAIVREGDAGQLAGIAAEISKYCKIRVETVAMPEAADASLPDLVARAKAAAGEAALVVVVISPDVPEPLMAAPDSGWSALNPDWIGSDGADGEVLDTRLQRQVFRAVGMTLGAGFRPEPKSLMHVVRKPADLDEIENCRFHAQSFIAMHAVAQQIGLEIIRPKPRKELEALGLLPPRPAANAPATDAPEESKAAD